MVFSYSSPKGLRHRLSGYSTFLFSLPLLSSPEIPCNDCDRHCLSFIDDIGKTLMIFLVILKSHHQYEQIQYPWTCFMQHSNSSSFRTPICTPRMAARGLLCPLSVSDQSNVLNSSLFWNWYNSEIWNPKVLRTAPSLPTLLLIYLHHTSSLTFSRSPGPSPFYILLIFQTPSCHRPPPARTWTHG